jgi:hypothetical protein
MGCEMVPWSRSVTVMVAELPAETVVGLALTVEWAALIAGAWKVMPAVCVSDTLSVLSAAVSVTDCAAESVTVNVVWPLVSVVAGDGPVMWVEQGEGVHAGVKVTVLPLTGTLLASRRVTVTVDELTPSAGTVAGEDATVELLADTPEATAAAVPSPAGVPLSVALGAMKKGADHRCGWVKSLLLSPM